MKSNLKKIFDLRVEIDSIDERIINLLNERIKLSYKIKDIKKKHNISAHMPERESEILSRIDDFIKDKKDRAIIKNIFIKILDESRGIQLSGSDE